MEKKLLFVASTGPHIRQFHLPYLQRLKQEGWRIHAACSRGGGMIPYAERVLDVPFRKRMVSVSNFRAAGLLRKQIRREGYDAVLVHTSLAAFFTRLAVMGLKDRPKVINTVHGYLFDDQTPFFKRILLLAAEKLTAPVTDLVITMNRFDHALAQTHRLGSKIGFVPGVGVDFDRLEAGRTHSRKLRKALDIRQEDFVVIYPAEFSRRKNQSLLLHAMTRLPENTVLVLPGAGQYRAKCQRLAHRLGIAHRVRFPGYVADMVPWYEMADAAVSTSRSEGLPFNIMEAMYLGLPVVASDVKGHTDLIPGPQYGLLFPFGDPEACAAEILRLLRDPELARSISKAASEEVMQYALSRVQPRLMSLYLQE
jgi:glycosyltransferase EpsD